MVGVGGGPKRSLSHRMNTQSLHHAVDTATRTLMITVQDVIDAVEAQCRILLMQFKDQAAELLV